MKPLSPGPQTALSPPADLLALMQERASFVLVTHVGPDGDAIGSLLGLRLALLQRGATVTAVCPTLPGQRYQWLPGAESIVTQLPPDEAATVILDCDSLTRTESLAPALARQTLAIIDHHTGEPFGQIVYKDPQAAATTVMIYRLLEALRWPLTPAIATCLYTGLAADTGFFRFENTNPEALQVAGALVAAGALPHQVAEKISETRQLRQLQLTGRALASLQKGSDERVVWGVLCPADYQATGTDSNDTEGIIDLFKQIQGQQACALIKAPSDERHWQISLRSPVVDVAAIAGHYGGGGHARAAGFEYEGELDTLQADLSGRLAAALSPREGET